MKAPGLPLQLTSLVGRQAQIDAVRRALRGSRLVTLTGTGGTGKTRLAVEVARLMEAEGEAEIWFVDLAPVRDPQLVGKAVLAVLGEREEPAVPVAEAIGARLENRPAILVLDNCEHLIRSCAAIALDLLRVLPELRLLATSRVPLEIAGERRWPVPTLNDQESLQLFVERARLVAPEFELTDQASPAAAELCRRLDGLPLALELAAARMGQLPVEEVLARLDQRLSLLVDRSAGTEPRHRTLGAALDWSFDLLQAGEKAPFTQLSVFVGGFGVTAAEQVAGADLDLLSRLVDKSLLLPARAADRQARFRLLESVREYAAERLRQDPGGETAARRHFEHYSQLAAAAASGLRGPDQITWLDRLEEEHDNLRAALDWGRRNQPEAAIEMAAGIAWFWNVRGHFGESVRRLGDLLAETGNGEARVRARGLAALGRLALNLPGRPGAEAALNESLELWRRLDEPAGRSFALLSRALLSIVSREPREACDRLIQEALEDARRAGDWHQEAEATAYLGITAYRLAADPAEGLRRVRQAAELARERGLVWVLAFALDFESAMELELGEVARATANLEEAMALWEALQDPEWLATTNALLGQAAIARADAAEAHRRLETALRSKPFEKPTDFPLGGPTAVGPMADLAALEGRYERAARLKGAADSLPVVAPQRKGDLEQQPWFAQAVRRLGEDRIRAAWEDGLQMTAAQAITYALEEGEAGSRHRRSPLTAREEEIAGLVSKGLLNREIADRLFIAERTVDAHVEHIRDKLGLRSKTEIAAWAARQDLKPKR